MIGDLPTTSPDWKPKAYIIGGLLGLGVGLLAAYFYARVTEENGSDSPGQIKTMDALKLGVSLLSILRQITDLGAGSGKK